MKIHLGCGSDIKEGYLNIDGYGSQYGTNNSTQRLVCDLTRGFPKFDLFNNSIKDVELICHTHFLEHLTTPNAIKLIKECYDILAPGGVLRSAIPSFYTLAKAYLEQDWAFFDIQNWDSFSDPKTRTFIDIVSEGVYQPHPNPYEEHKSVWDTTKAIKIMEYCGFRDVKEVPYDISYEPDTELRRRYTFVISATK